MEVNRNLEISKRKSQHRYTRYFSPVIDIYDQVQLLKSNNINSLIKPTLNTEQIAVIFDIDGELSGKAVCIMDNHLKSFQELSLTQSLFIESMNILLGQFLTNLEEETGVMAVISSPKVVMTEEIIPNFDNYSKNSKVNFSLNYHLISNGNEHFTTVTILGNKISDIYEV